MIKHISLKSTAVVGKNTDGGIEERFIQELMTCWNEIAGCTATILMGYKQSKKYFCLVNTDRFFFIEDVILKKVRLEKGNTLQYNKEYHNIKSPATLAAPN